jgi:integrase
MSVRKRVWGPAHDRREAWVVDYVDGAGVRRLKTFTHKKAADTYAANTHIQVIDGTHIADSASLTVKEAGNLWLVSCQQAGLEQTSYDQYEQHLRLHIVPFIGATRLSKLSIPTVRGFEDRLHQEGRSAAMIRRVIGSLGALLGDAQERGLVVRNSVSELRRNSRRKGSKRRVENRGNGKLKVGVDIPTPAEVKALLATAAGRWRPLLLTTVFTGLRASELRGLQWADVDLKRGELHVRQRADRFNAIGRPKSEAGERTVPLPPALVSELREWKLKCPGRKTSRKDAEGKPVREPHFVFPTGAGNVENHHNICQRGLIPTMIKAGITIPVLDEDGHQLRDEDGVPVVDAKYTGLHSLRHFFASWCINRKVDGGLELPAKVVQERLGHSSITMTLDTYGHLFPRGDDTAELAAAEASLLG